MSKTSQGDPGSFWSPAGTAWKKIDTNSECFTPGLKGVALHMLSALLDPDPCSECSPGTAMDGLKAVKDSVNERKAKKKVDRLREDKRQRQQKALATKKQVQERGARCMKRKEVIFDRPLRTKRGLHCT